VDMQDMYFRLTIDIFTHLAFGVDLDFTTDLFKLRFRPPPREHT